jgi:hypothetical protein
MVAPLFRFRLSDKPETRGLRCAPDGLSLARVALLRKTAAGFAARPTAEVDALLIAAYGRAHDAERVSRGLEVAAAALNRGELGLAMMAALHLRLADPSPEGAARIAAVDNALAKYPGQPRDWHGRWTTGDGGRAGPPPPSSKPSAPPSPPASKPECDWGGPSHPTGGYLIHVQEVENDDYGSNEPPPKEGRPEPPPDPVFPAPKVPPGWDRNVDGQDVRIPRLRNGQPWPVVTEDAIFSNLIALPKGGRPSMSIYVPQDGRGPMLIGSDRTEEFVQPPGYDKVMLYGIPQETASNGVRTNHALDSVQAVLEDAATDNFEAFYFNSAISTSTAGSVVSRLRPDVMAVSRPEFDPNVRYWPYESYSPRQDPLARAEQLRLDPTIAGVRGRAYKFLRMLWARLRRLAGW